MGSFSAFHWIVVLAVALLIFGTGKLRSLGADLGGAIKDFKKQLGDEAASKHPDNPDEGPAGREP